MPQTDSLVLVSIEDMFIYYNRNDDAFTYALTDPRAAVVLAETAGQRWHPGDASVDDAWPSKGMGLFSLCAIHMWNHNLDFTYYDVGANVGMTTIAQAIFFRRCGRSNRTIAFEPGPIHYALSQSIALNGLDGAVTLHKAAASDTVGEVTFHVTPDQSPASSMLSAAVGREGVVSTNAVRVLSVKLDDIIATQDAPHALIKIDAEGADFRVISGLSKALSSRYVIMTIEFFPELVETYTDPVKRLLALSTDYEIFEVDGTCLKPILPNEQNIEGMIVKTKQRPMPATDLMFLPKKLPHLSVLRARLCDN